MRALTLRTHIERWPLAKPFHISGHTWEHVEVLLVTLERTGHVGRGEAAGIYYRNDNPVSMLKLIETLRPSIEALESRESLQTLLPPGGARNALDCALWDLEAKLSGRAAWQIAGLAAPQPLVTTFTCGADTPDNMAAAAREYVSARAIKLKLTGDSFDAARVRAVREARTDVWLSVDANQSFTPSVLEGLLPALLDARVALIEQPFPMDRDAWLDGYQAPIPIAADESAQDLEDIPGLVGRFSMVNIKLDKCGGLTEGLAMARAARALGLETMVGNMMGTSLAMAPAYLVGQMCRLVDLDGPAVLKADRVDPVKYVEGLITCPQSLWGGSSNEKARARTNAK
jgi:L-alanine-DL-glutamate epimerase-like enolase superfamily enzyme